ncbi:MAG: T9SS type A sorting domain-containing protein [Saprospiraceae bacterium]|nr:T9SS type A sorting domain-containing protein [Saprospiraceae bacterium]
MFKHFFTLVLAGLAASASAQSVTWAADVAPILYKNCVNCHRSGGIGHFSLIGYNNAVAAQGSIQYKTETRQMPPWKADPNYRHFAGENVLSETEIQTIKDWVAGGTLPGNLAQAPPDPVFNSSSTLGSPDLVLQTPLHTMTATEDEYRCFVLPAGLAQTAFLRGLEVIPGNHEVVHHVLVFQDATGQARQLDQQTPEPGYVSFGGIGVDGARLVGAWVPGSQSRLLPPFMGIKLDAGADLVVQVHFPASAYGKTESSKVNLFFTPGNQGIREVTMAPLLNHLPPSLQNGPLVIPANAVKTFHAQFTTPIAGSLLAVAPHMHLLGQRMECFAKPVLGDTIPLIRIPEWDFHWQGSYTFQKVQKVPAGAKLHAYATYDNTSNNPNNPSNPPKNVALGEATTDEMMLVYFLYMAYQAGDENIVLDSTLIATSAPEVQDNAYLGGLRVFPNPASGGPVSVEYELKQTADIQGSLTDLQGRVLKIFALRADAAPGLYRETTTLSDLPPGAYLLRIQTAQGATLITKIIN